MALHVRLLDVSAAFYTSDVLASEARPPRHLFRGELGEELIVLSIPVVRIAERLGWETQIETADGFVTGRAGDFVITAASGERYPILASVFYGTYQILGSVGSRFV